MNGLHDAMAAVGVTAPPSGCRADSGGFIRYGKGNRYYLKQLDDVAFFGDWSTGESGHYFNDDGKTLTPAELEACKQKLATLRKEQEAQRQQGYDKAANEALARWNSLSEAGASPYLTNKQINAYGVRFDGEAIVVPVRDATGKLWSLQTIQPDGGKRFFSGGKVSGGFHRIGDFDNPQTIIICEGYATGASIHKATGLPVIIAFNAGNLLPVSKTIREAYPKAAIILAADDDRWADSNIGKAKADEAAKQCGGKVLLPAFDAIHDDKQPTDFNDLYCLQGLEEVKRQLSTQYAHAREEFLTECPIDQPESDESVISRLAELPPLDYARQAKEAAKEMGVAKLDIDKAVKEHKAQTKINEAGSSELFPAVESWPEQVSGDTLLTELTATFKRYAILPDHADTALALWVTFTWCIDAVKIAPILAICSPEKQCGKTTVLSLVSQLVSKALPTANISPAALFRGIELWQPTMLIDEADTFIREAEELRGVINSGHTRPTAFVIRTTGDDHEPTRFSTWGAKAIALIGKLPETLHDRSIVIELRRKLAGEETQKLRYCDDDLFIPLRRKLQRFAEDYHDDLKLLRPELPTGVSDRAADNWEPLLAIASIAGGDWPDKAMQAAKVLSAYDNAATSLGTELLTDIEALFQSTGYNRFTTKELIEALCEDDERPWLTYNRGRVIAPRQIAKFLGEYGIHSKNLKSSMNSVAKGYELSQFEDAFTRYLSSSPSTPENKRYPLPAAETLEKVVADNGSTNATRYLSATEESSVSAACSGRTDNLGGMEQRVEIEL